MANIIATMMYVASKGDKVHFNQTGSESDSQEFQNHYWRSIFCLFESSQRLNVNSRHLLFTNGEPPAVIDGINTRQLMEAYRIELVHIEGRTRPPKEYYSQWNIVFVMLDVIDKLKSIADAEDHVYLLDADCFFNKPISDAMTKVLRAQGSMFYNIDYQRDRQVHAMSLSDLETLATEEGVCRPGGYLKYCGGELVGLRGDLLFKFSLEARLAYDMSLERYRAGKSKFNTEEHLLSYVHYKLGYPDLTGNPFIKRIYTNQKDFVNLEGDEDRYVIWHLPAEKKRGFKSLFQSFGKQNTTGAPPDYGKIFHVKISPPARMFWTFYKLLQGWKRTLLGEN